jgi:hypothetical protein
MTERAGSGMLGVGVARIRGRRRIVVPERPKRRERRLVEDRRKIRRVGSGVRRRAVGRERTVRPRNVEGGIRLFSIPRRCVAIIRCQESVLWLAGARGDTNQRHACEDGECGGRARHDRRPRRYS